MKCKHCKEELILGDNQNNITDKSCVVCDEARFEEACYDDSYFEEGR